MGEELRPLGVPRTAAPDLARAADAPSAEASGLDRRCASRLGQWTVGGGEVPDMHRANEEAPNTPSSHRGPTLLPSEAIGTPVTEITC